MLSANTASTIQKKKKEPQSSPSNSQFAVELKLFALLEIETTNYNGDQQPSFDRSPAMADLGERMHQVRRLEFFHGTSARAASLLLQGTKPRSILSSMKLLAGEIMVALSRHEPNFYRLGSVFEDAGSEYPVSAPLGIQELSSGHITSTYSYDQMWVSTNFEAASGYAKRHAHGSEALNFLLDGITALEFLGETSARDMLLCYPNLNEVLQLPHQPVVLTFSGLSHDRILSDRNEVVEWNGIFERIELSGFQPSFRLVDPKPSDVVGIRVLEGYNPGGRGPIPSKSEVALLDPLEWLANRTASQ